MILIGLDTYGQQSSKKTISGYVKEAGTGELLPGVSIYSEKLGIGTSTNTFGFYSFTVEQDSLEITFASIGYLSQIKKILLKSDLELNIVLQSDVNELKEAVVTAESRKRVSSDVQMSVIDIPVKQVKQIPSLLGEKDVLKAIQLMPGVQSGSEGQSGLYVRGGGPDQNLIILDDAVVYNAQHLFGFFSIFNGDALRSIELYKGGFPARYSGRLSSVLEMNMKEGNREKVTGEMGIGVISSRGLIEGPLPKTKGKGSFLISGRRTYIDILTQPFILSATKGNETAGYFFYDLNAKANYDFNGKDRIFLSGYFGRDKFYYRERSEFYDSKGQLGWGNGTGTLRWNHLFSNKVFANTSFIFSNYELAIKAEEKYAGDKFILQYFSGIMDLSLKYDVQYLPNPRHTVRTGFLATRHRFTPQAFVIKDELDPDLNLDSRTRTNAFEGGIYIEDIYKPDQRWQINPGFRWSIFNVEGRTYNGFEPRFSVSYSFTSTLSAKGSYALMNQYIHLLSNTGVGLPTDLWVPATDRVLPQRSQQIAMGLAKDILKPGLAITVEGYYKTMNNIIGYKPGASYLSIDDDPLDDEQPDWQDNVTSGKGTSYGFEFLLQKKTGDFTGWIGYTLSWTELQFDELNFGKPFWARYDRRHDISIVLMHKISDHISVAGTWVYGTGNAITLPLAEYRGEVHESPNWLNWLQYSPLSDYGEMNSFRMHSYHRLDLGIQISKEKTHGIRTWDISMYNAYNRKNPYFYFIDYEFNNDGESGKRVLKQFSLFPVIPSVSWSFKFN